MNSQNQTTREYHARVNTPDGCFITIKGPDLTTVQKKVQANVGGAPRLEEHGENTRWIFTDNYLQGKQPCGTLVEIEVPAALSTKHITDQRMAAQRAA